MPSLINKESFLQLLRLGLGHNLCAQPMVTNWLELEALASRQGLSAIIIDGIDKLPEGGRPPKAHLLQWIGETLQGYEYRYELYRRAIAEIAGWYNTHGYKMMVLKGYACSMNWPKPEHRPCGDIDIWLFGNQEEADALLSNEKGIKVDSSHHHHTVFEWNGFSIENHYDFINIHRHKSNERYESILKQLGSDDSHWVDIFGERVYLPSPDLHALFLLRHSLMDFSASELSLRQVLDWAFWVKTYTNEINWNMLLGILDDFHMKDFFNCLNAICVEDLGFSPTIFPKVQFLPQLKERVLNDIINPRYPREEPKCIFKKYVYKYRRWKGNEWKHTMCYEESMWSSFWSGVWAKMLKPKSI